MKCSIAMMLSSHLISSHAVACCHGCDEEGEREGGRWWRISRTQKCQKREQPRAPTAIIAILIIFSFFSLLFCFSFSFSTFSDSNCQQMSYLNLDANIMHMSQQQIFLKIYHQKGLRDITKPILAIIMSHKSNCSTDLLLC